MLGHAGAGQATTACDAFAAASPRPPSSSARGGAARVRPAAAPPPAPPLRRGRRRLAMVGCLALGCYAIGLRLAPRLSAKRPSAEPAAKPVAAIAAEPAPADRAVPAAATPTPAVAAVGATAPVAAPESACCSLGVARALTPAQIGSLDDGRLPVTLGLLNGRLPPGATPRRASPELADVACDVPCALFLATRPPASLARADVLVFASNSGSPPSVPARVAALGGAKRLACLSMESEAYYPELAPERLRARGLLSLTTDRRSDVPVTYLRRGSIAVWGRRPPAFDAARLAAHEAARLPLATLVASNCNARSARARLFAQLRAALDGRVDSLGRCGRTSAWPRCAPRAAGAPARECSKHGALRTAPFHLAFENSAVRDYVTEKVFDALEAGVVPVYLGAPNGGEFVPPGAALFAADFAHNASALAAHLLALAREPAAYAALHAWRTRPLPAAYVRRWAPYVLTRMHCRLCRRAYALRHEAAGNVSWAADEQSLVLGPRAAG